jgi:hypothetical protein
MSHDPESQRLAAEEFEFHDDVGDGPISLGNNNHNNGAHSSQTPSRSMYHLPASEQLRGVANRIIFSRYYILFYFVMMSLSATTVVLSLMSRGESRVGRYAGYLV